MILTALLFIKICNACIMQPVLMIVVRKFRDASSNIINIPHPREVAANINILDIQPSSSYLIRPVNNQSRTSIFSKYNSRQPGDRLIYSFLMKCYIWLTLTSNVRFCYVDY